MIYQGFKKPKFGKKLCSIPSKHKFTDGTKHNVSISKDLTTTLSSFAQTITFSTSKEFLRAHFLEYLTTISCFTNFPPMCASTKWLLSFVLFLSNHNVIPPTVWGHSSHTNPSPYLICFCYV
jgi:hypothetical protein